MLLLVLALSAAHSVDYWVYTQCAVALEPVPCSRMVALPFRIEADDNVLMCCKDIVPHYLADMRACRPATTLWPNGTCATVVTADIGAVAWCCAPT